MCEICAPAQNSVAGDQRGAVAPGRRVDEGIRHGESVGERQVRRLESQGLVDRRDRRAPQRGDRLERALLREISTDDLVDLVDLDCRDEKRLRTFEVAGEPIGPRPVGKVLDPATRVDQDQRRSFFSRNSRSLAPRATPRNARIGRSGTR
jgi:hypothetical protein